MAIKLMSAKEVAVRQGLKILVHGLAGSGKTRLCTTTGEETLIISAEAGLLSIRESDVQVAEVSSMADIEELYAMLVNEPHPFKWVCLDSISEIAEVVLAYEKAASKDPRQAYGALADRMAGLIRAFRDLSGINVVMTAKQERVKDDNAGLLLFVPSMPGQKLGQQISYWFDEVFALRVEKTAEGEVSRWLQTSRDLQYEAKDRSGSLDLFEAPDLAAIKSKILGG